MLLDIDTGKPVISQPYHKEFNIWRNRLLPERLMQSSISLTL